MILRPRRGDDPEKAGWYPEGEDFLFAFGAMVEHHEVIVEPWFVRRPWRRGPGEVRWEVC